METTHDTTRDTHAFVNVTLRAWQLQVSRANDLFDALPDEAILRPIAPGRNRGVYVLGHLVAVHDAMLPLLDLGPRRHADLDPIFVRTPDNPETPIPDVAVLKAAWKKINEDLQQHFNRLQPEEWLSRHTAISAEDFAREPHRNKLSVLLSRTSHVAYHLGQLVWLKKTAAD